MKVSFLASALVVLVAATLTSAAPIPAPVPKPIEDIFFSQAPDFAQFETISYDGGSSSPPSSVSFDASGNLTPLFGSVGTKSGSETPSKPGSSSPASSKASKGVLTTTTGTDGDDKNKKN